MSKTYTLEEIEAELVRENRNENLFKDLDKHLAELALMDDQKKTLDEFCKYYAEGLAPKKTWMTYSENAGLGISRIPSSLWFKGLG